MRKYLQALGALLIVALAGCGNNPSPAPAVSSRAPASSGATVPATTPSSGHPRPDPSPGPSRGDPDNPVDRVGAPIVLTGTVDTAGGCVVLTVNGRRWALTGDAAARLTDGQIATVRGRPVPAPADCGATEALEVRTVH
ncbi:hypothetical protein [Actinoplanes sp. NPDC020271]|uniref:hypothetical protein n=1 Tax=Actinoplanes sp. NPDC020271 TaxID=3363896 RepID=UPI0037A71697